MKIQLRTITSNIITLAGAVMTLIAGQMLDRCMLNDSQRNRTFLSSSEKRGCQEVLKIFVSMKSMNKGNKAYNMYMYVYMCVHP
jgi:hypothetical protein